MLATKAGTWVYKGGCKESIYPSVWEETKQSAKFSCFKKIVSNYM